MENKRYIKIDFLRGFSILIMIFLHTSAYFLSDKKAFFWWNWAHFAVPIFVFCSGFVLFRKYKNISTIKEYIFFIKNRFVRLLKPYYIFLIVFFLIVVTSRGLSLQNPKNLLSAIFLYGYEPDISWLVILFLQLTLIFPLLHFLYKKKRLFLALFFLSIGSAILLDFAKFNIDYRIYMFIPWLSPFLLAFFYHRLEAARKGRIFLMLALIFSFIWQKIFFKSVADNPVLQYNKFPPDFYYLSYGLAWLLFLDLIFEIKIFEKERVVKFFNFFSFNSYNLFFIHYLVIQATYRFYKNPPFNWLALFVYVVGVSSLVSVVLNKLQTLTKLSLRAPAKQSL